MLAEHNGGTGAALIDYIYSGSRLLAKVAGGTTNYFLSDRLSVRLVLDANGNVVGRQGHLPYGEDFAESGTQQKKHFTSYERDPESGIDYAVNRYYGPSVGRFTSVDPYKGSNDLNNPQSFNRYIYVGNDPTNRTDPFGLYSFPWSIIDLGNGEYVVRFCFRSGEISWCEWSIISEHDPRRDQKKPLECAGHTKAPLTGDKLAKYNAELTTIKAKLSTDKCKEYLGRHGIDPAKALEAVNMQRPYDGNKSDISYLEAGVIPPDEAALGGLFFKKCISGQFKSRGKDLGALTGAYPEQKPPDQTTVDERSDVYYGDNFSAATILHEALHSLFGATDQQLANMLGNIDISGGSRAISKALQKNGCGD